MSAVSQNGLALQFVDFKNKEGVENPNIKDRYDIVKAAVMQNGLALKFVDLKNHDITKQVYEIVQEAVSQNGLALQYAPESLQKDVEIVKDAVYNNSMALFFADNELKKNRDVAMVAITNDADGFEYAAKAASYIHDDIWTPEFIDAALHHNPAIALHLYTDPRYNREYFMDLIQ
jgi:hypothetical protein